MPTRERDRSASGRSSGGGGGGGGGSGGGGGGGGGGKPTTLLERLAAEGAAYAHGRLTWRTTLYDEVSRN